MARKNRTCAAWVTDLLDVQPSDRVLEVGFGPGVGIQLLTSSASAGYVAGVDPSKEMVAQATTRNKKAIESGRVDLRHGPVASLPFADNTSTRPWRLTPCKSGPTPWQAYGKCGGA
jgi:ubiquinone/menaquinone biosynthesis C-methylase UbiE